MKRAIILITSIAVITALSSCDMRSGTAKREMEKFQSSPTPPILPQPTGTPVAANEIANVDTTVEGDKVSFEGYEEKSSLSCTKFNRVHINGDTNEVSIKGVCSRIMVNGDSNKIKIDAAVQLVFNGTNNTVQYSRYANGKMPIVTENRTGNLIEKAPTTTATKLAAKSNIVE